MDLIEWKNNEENRDMENKLPANSFPLHRFVNIQHHCYGLEMQSFSTDIKKKLLSFSSLDNVTFLLVIFQLCKYEFFNLVCPRNILRHISLNSTDTKRMICK